jgi:hypothetical protein
LNFYNNDLYDARSDYIYSQVGGVNYYNNTLRDRGVWDNDHVDGFHVWGSFTKIYNNTFYNFVRSPDDNHVNSYIRLVPWDATQNATPQSIYIYNNLFYENRARTPAADSSFRGIEAAFYTSDSVSDILIANNTFAYTPYSALILSFGSGATGMATAAVSNIRVLNNIFYNCTNSGTLDSPTQVLNISRGDGSITYGDSGEDVDVKLDYNVVYSPGAPYGSSISYAGTTYTYANFLLQNVGQVNGVTTDPLFTSAGSYTIQSGSPAKDKGADLSATFTTDIRGKTRIGAFDIGAYEFTNNVSIGAGATWNLGGSGPTVTLGN